MGGPDVGLTYLYNWCSRTIWSASPTPQDIANLTKEEIQEMITKAMRTGYFFVRIAGLSGAVAIIMGAYGSHKIATSEIPEKQKRSFESASRYHLINSLALLGVPLTRRPALVGSLLMSGMILFCGTCYFNGITGNNSFNRAAPIGGSLLILGWLAMAL